MEPSIAELWGESLRTARLSAGLTQIELSERIDASQFTISRLEGGRHRPSDESKIALAKALGLTVEKLFPYTVSPAERERVGKVIEERNAERRAARAERLALEAEKADRRRKREKLRAERLALQTEKANRRARRAQKQSELVGASA